MKLLLDESVPRKLGGFFPDTFEVHTVQRMGWAGSKNGDLLKQAAGRGFDALITTDQGIEAPSSPIEPGQAPRKPVIPAEAGIQRLS